MIRIGTILYGYCGGYFDHDSYGNKRVEAIGADWIVVRDDDGKPDFYHGNLENLESYTVKENV